MARLQQGYLFDSRYELLQKIGEGGYAELWLVNDTIGGIELVLKVFLPNAQLDDHVVELFREEFKLVYNINHPNLLKYSDFNVCMGYPYLKMPYYRFGSAESLIGHCTEQTGWRYLRDVAAGLACLHAQSPAIIHQDIKPANVLLDDNNFIITDFGISASVYSLVKESKDNRVVNGSPPYMPPEKFQNNPQIYAESDIWSLGASLYELLTGNLPFGRGGGRSQLNGTVMPPRPDNISYDMWSVISCCLSIYPEQRPTASMLEEYAEKKLNAASNISSLMSDPYTNSGNHGQNVSSSQSGQSYRIPTPPNTKSERNFLPWIMALSGVAVIAAMVVLFSFLLSGTGNSNREVDKSSPIVKEDTSRNSNVGEKLPKKKSPKDNYTVHPDYDVQNFPKSDFNESPSDDDDDDDIPKVMPKETSKDLRPMVTSYTEDKFNIRR